MKKLAWILGGLFIAMVVALVSVPLFVNVDQYRGVITDEVNKRIQGKVELGKLHLSLWGAIKIHAESIVVKVNGFPDPMVDTKNFHLEIPFLSVLTGAPNVTAVLEQPKISLVKETDGRLNALELVKKPNTASLEEPNHHALAMLTGETTIIEDQISQNSSAPEKKSESGKKSETKAKVGEKSSARDSAGADSSKLSTEAAAVDDPQASSEGTSSISGTASAASATDASNTTQEPTKVPAILQGATLGLKIEQGDLTYADKLAKANYAVNGLEFHGQNLGLGSTMKLQMKAPVKGERADGKFEGPVTLQLELTPLLVDQVVKSVKGDVDFDASGLAIQMPGKLEKPSGMALTVKARFDGDEKETLLKQFDLRFHEALLHAKGRILTNPLSMKVDVNSDPFSLSSMKDFVPLLKEYDLKGKFQMNALVDYSLEKLKLSGDLKVQDGSVTYAKMLKAPIQFHLQAGFSENSLNITRANVAAPDTDLQILGNVKNFFAPQFSVSISGRSLNVDKLLVLPSGESTAKSNANAGKFFWLIPIAHAQEKKGGNPILALAANPMIAGASGVLNAQIAKVVAYGSTFENALVKAQLQNLQLKVSEASVRIFGGQIKSDGDFDLRNPALKYSSRGNASNISAKEALKTYFPKFQNTFEGTMRADWNLGGNLYPETLRLKTLKGKAKIVATDGALKSVDFQSQINSMMQKVPFLKDKKPIEIDDGFKSMMADLNFDGGVIKAEPIEVQPRNKGFVVKGKSSILESLEQESFLDIYDPQGRLPKEFQSKAGKPAIALRLYGPISAPKTDYEYTIKKLASGAGANVAKDAAGKLLDKVLGGGGSGQQGGQGGGSGDALKDAADKLKQKFKLFR